MSAILHAQQAHTHEHTHSSTHTRAHTHEHTHEHTYVCYIIIVLDMFIIYMCMYMILFSLVPMHAYNTVMHTDVQEYVWTWACQLVALLIGYSLGPLRGMCVWMCGCMNTD